MPPLEYEDKENQGCGGAWSQGCPLVGMGSGAASLEMLGSGVQLLMPLLHMQHPDVPQHLQQGGQQKISFFPRKMGRWGRGYSRPQWPAPHAAVLPVATRGFSARPREFLNAAPGGCHPVSRSGFRHDPTFQPGAQGEGRCIISNLETALHTKGLRMLTAASVLMTKH